MTAMSELGIKEALARVVDRRDLTADEMAAVVGQIMDGQATPAQIGALLAALRMKGETVDEVVGAARAMRARMIPVDFAAEAMVDTCGTGGDGSRSVNVSTIAAFVVAAAGVVGRQARQPRPVVAVGRARRHRGAGAGPGARARAVGALPARGEAGFLFAPAHHAATKHAVGPRKEVGFRTLFNLLGPLTNPAGVRLHVNGIFARERCELLAQAHGALGSRRAHGGPRRGRPRRVRARRARPSSPSSRTARCARYEVGPADFGLAESDPAGLAGGTPADNARIALEVLRGGGPGGGAQRRRS